MAYDRKRPRAPQRRLKEESMKAILKFNVKHPLAATLLYIIPPVILINLIIPQTAPFLRTISVVVAVLCYAAAFFFVAFSLNMLMKDQLRAFNNCDPFPLIEITGELWGCDLKGNSKMITAINLNAALSAAGRYKEGYDLLKSADPSECRGNTAYLQTVFFNNLSSVCANLGYTSEYETYYGYSRSCYEQCGKKLKKRLDPVLRQSQAGYEYMHGNYSAALRLIPGEERSLYGKVCGAWLAAECYIKLNDTENARKSLEFVIQNGNKLFIAAKAMDMMESLDQADKK